MARRLRIEYAGAIYHIACRGVERRTIFLDDRDRRRFLAQLARATADCQIRLYLYCLMPNHFHLLAETPQANLQTFMHKLETAYTVYFNRRHQRVGHLMQGRYRAQPVQGDDYLLKLSRYIHLNPVCVRNLRDKPIADRLVALQQYRWSSYREYVGLAPSLGCLDTGPLLRLVGGAGDSASREYGRYAEAGLARSDEEFTAWLHSCGWVVGDEGFREQMDQRYRSRQERVACLEDVAFRRVRARRSLEEVLSAVASVFGLPVAELRRRHYGGRARAVAARMLWKYAGLNQRQIGQALGIGTGAAVCQQLRTLEVALETNPALRSSTDRVEQELSLDS